MVACCDEAIDRAAQHGWSLQQALATLCEYELSEREQRRLQRHLHEARLPVGKTLTMFDMATLDPFQRQRLNALANDRTWIEQAANLLLFGASGLGNSHIAIELTGESYRKRAQANRKKEK